jgi:CRP-like cAMP-binding protein
LNQLLAALPPAEYERIRPALEIVGLRAKEILHKPGEPIRFVYFPEGGFASILTSLEDGSMVEVASVGREGMIGVAGFAADGHPAPAVSMVQVEIESCYRMGVPDFRRELDRRGPLYEMFTRYTEALVGFVMQSAACNAVHSVEQRLARWLLLAHDRVGTRQFPLTQEFLAMMLGASRPTVTVAAGMLQRAGLITYRRGVLTIIDRAKLESASCECYRATRKLLRGVLRRRTPDPPRGGVGRE